MEDFQICNRGDVWLAVDIETARRIVRKSTDGVAMMVRHRREHAVRQAAAKAYRKAEYGILAEQRDSERRNRALWVRSRVRPERLGQAAHKPNKTRRLNLRAASRLLAQKSSLPRYSRAIIDRAGARGIYFRVSYYGRASKPGVGSRVTKYIWDGAHEAPDGRVLFESNVGESIDEAMHALSLVEQLNREAQKSAKALFHCIANVPYQLVNPELMMEIGREFAEQQFGSRDLPYALALHPPSAEGDQRNWHLHILFSTRPMVRTASHEWDVGTMLRTETDNPEAFDRMRHLYAAIQTEVVQRAGLDFTYTALSNAERGLPNQRQKHLGGKETARVRAGEYSAINERNREIVQAGEAALRDEQMRHGQEQIAAEAALVAKALKFAVQLSPSPLAAAPPLGIACQSVVPVGANLGDISVPTNRQRPSTGNSPSPIGVSHLTRMVADTPDSPTSGRSEVRPWHDGDVLMPLPASVVPFPARAVDFQLPLTVSGLKPSSLDSSPSPSRIGMAVDQQLSLKPLSTPSTANPKTVRASSASLSAQPTTLNMVPMVAVTGSLPLPAIAQAAHLVRRTLTPSRRLPPISRVGVVGLAVRLSTTIPQPIAPRADVETHIEINASRQLARASTLASKPKPLPKPAPPTVQTDRLGQDLVAISRVLAEQDAKRAARSASKVRTQAAELEQRSAQAQPGQISRGLDAASPSPDAGPPPAILKGYVSSNPTEPATRLKPMDASTPKPSEVAGRSLTSDTLLIFAAERRKKRSAQWLQAHHQKSDVQKSDPKANVRQLEPDRTTHAKPWRPEWNGPER